MANPPVPPPISPAVIPPAVVPPAVVPPVAKPASPVIQPVSGATTRSLPPPPPPRSTLPPVRTAATATPARMTTPRPEPALGSATGVRWRGEVEELGGADAEADKTIPEELTRTFPSWLASLVVHLMILILLALLTGPVGESVGRVFLTIGQSDGKDEGELADFEMNSEVDLSEMMAESLVESPVDVALDMANLEMNESPLLEAVPTEMGIGPIAIPSGPMVSGRTGAMKNTLMAIYGGTPITQEAVESGLVWLAKQQAKDGSWSLRGPYNDGGTQENKPAATAMALLAFLGNGNTHLDGEYKDNVARGVKWLVAQQDRDGFFAKKAQDHQQAYAQAQASLAICELYAMTRDSWLHDKAQLAVDCAEQWQAEEGGWRYQPGFDSDTSITGWFVMVLQSALSAGLKVNQAVLYRVPEFLDTVQDYDGAAYAYQPRRAPTEAMTAEGLLCRQYLGWPHNHPALVRGVDAISTEYNFDINRPDFYYWYYATQVLHHYGGKEWQAWNNQMREQLPKAQIKRGRDAGSWPPQADNWGGPGGRLYTTCFAIYCLEVYYRHMPLYKPEHDSPAIAGSDKAVD